MPQKPTRTRKKKSGSSSIKLQPRKNPDTSSNLALPFDLDTDVPVEQPKSAPAKKQPEAKPGKKKKKIDREEILDTPLSVVLEELGIEDYDLLLVGDGSGSSWGKPCGWATVAVEKTSFQRQVFYGSMSQGTSSISELMAYLQPLLWYVDVTKKRRKEQDLRPSIKKVHILTDNAYCQKSGEQNQLRAKQGSALSVMLNSIAAQGFDIRWHWIRRESVGLNIYTDRLSRAARLLLQNATVQQDVQEASPIGRDVNECNPSS